MQRSEGVTLARRTERIVVREFGDEVVVYDLDSDQVTHLDRQAAAVWLLCDGRSTPADLAEAAELSEDDVAVELSRLHEAGLLVEDGGWSRRQLLQRMGIAVAVAPLITVTAATAAAASSVRTVTVIRTTCTNWLLGATVTLNVSVTGFTPGNVSVVVTYVNWLGNSATRTGVIVANGSGSGSTSIQINVRPAPAGNQTVSVTASSQVAPGEVTTVTQAITSC